jgi:replicative DNA helicase
MVSGAQGEKLIRLLPLRYISNERIRRMVERVQDGQPLSAHELLLIQEAKANAGYLERPELYLDALLSEGFAQEVRQHASEIQQAVQENNLALVRDLLSKPPLEMRRDDETDLGAVLESLETNDLQVISLGKNLEGIENIWGPLLPGGVYTIAAPEGSGKSALAEQIMLNAATAGVSCVDFSIELSSEARALRYAQHLYGPSVGPMAFYNRLRNPRGFNEADSAKAKQALSGLPLYVESGVENIHHLLSLADRYISRRNAKLFTVDFIQAMSGERGQEDPYTVITQAMKLLYTFARDNQVTFLVLSQMNREGVKAAMEGKALNNTALEGSGKIGQFSWVVSFIIKNEVGATMHTTKNRPTGMLGQIPLRYNGAYLSFHT